MDWGLRALGLESMSISRVATALGVTWHTANSAILARAEQTIVNDPDRFEGARVIGVDEHAWRRTRKGDRYVTVVIDLTPVRDGTGPARLPGMVEGGPEKAFKDWPAERDQGWRERVEVVATGRFHRVQVRRRRGAARSLSMFLCKRVRSEMGVDSVGVGGGELGQGLLPVGGDLSLDESALGPARVGGRVLLLGALRGPAVLDVADPPATAV